MTVNNTMGRLEEAETDSCTSPITPITDEWFSYDADGRLVTVYESTPNSGGCYAVSASYWANGTLDQLSGLPGLPTITYGVDGEGRPYSTSASSGQNPATSATYNAASEALGVTFGSGDSDSFQYDSNTDRITQYKFSVNGQSVVGDLGWNANGTLASLGITDPFNSGNAQSCTYSHDDLARLASANCGSVWSQTFTYDPFGNLSKSGTMSFQPAYSWTTNHVTTIGGFTAAYDSDGDVTNDGLNTFTWDAYGKPITANSVTLTFDALGRMVEQDNGGIYTEIVYSPTGVKLALMTGQTLKEAFVAVPAGATAVYDSSGLHYRHAGWLGDVRLPSTTSRTVSGDVSCGPFGEPYAQSGSPDLSFTGQNQDTSGNLYDFMYRGYGVQGRWPSPDPLRRGAFKLADPQSLDLYAYVRNSPMNLIDPLGLVIGTPYDCPPDTCVVVNGGTPVPEGAQYLGFYLWSSSGLPAIGQPLTTYDPEAVLYNLPIRRPPPKVTLDQETCAEGLKEAGQNQAAVARASQNWDLIASAANDYNIAPSMLAAVGVRESGFLDRHEVDGAGVGIGVFQITVNPTSGVTAGQASDLTFATFYAAETLAFNLGYVSANFPNFTPFQALQAAAAGYNFNILTNLTGNPNTIDVGTAHDNYGSDILLLMDCF